MKQTTKAYGAAMLQAVLIGFSFLAVKIALESADAINLLAHRFTVAFCSVGVYHLLKRNAAVLKGREWLRILPLSAAYPIFFFLFQTLGLTLITSSEAGIVNAVTPVTTLLIAGLLIKERVNGRQKVLMAVSVAGVVLISLMNGLRIGSGSYLGFLFILASTVSYAFYYVLARKFRERYPVVMIVSVVSCGGFAVFNLISLAQHFAVGNLSGYFAPFQNVRFVLAITYLGLVSSFVTSLLGTYAVSHLEATKVGLFNHVATVVSIFAGVLFLHETMRWYHFAGIAAILLGTLGFNLVSDKEKSD